MKKLFAFSVVVLMLFTAYFYRVPDIDIPNVNDSVVLSPADGTVEYITFSKDIEVFKDGNSYKLNISKYFPEGAYVIGIFMSPLDVHVNRAPVSGKVVYMKHIDGSFYPAFFNNVEKNNERNIMIIKANNGDYIGVVQIAGVVAKRCVYYVHVNDTVEVGELIGKIKLGSQTALILPKNYKILVKVGEHVKGGKTIIAIRNN
ncbi:archaetidylserine decarboxylase [Methanocaldococcus indicus]|uniref:archaetidylserine decarboxylase n=1 Tax=Methanocaldococcus indicus TaxID=213231 RepID=UPI003C6D1643